MREYRSGNFRVMARLPGCTVASHSGPGSRSSSGQRLSSQHTSKGLRVCSWSRFKGLGYRHQGYQGSRIVSWNSGCHGRQDQIHDILPYRSGEFFYKGAGLGLASWHWLVWIPQLLWVYVCSLDSSLGLSIYKQFSYSAAVLSKILRVHEMVNPFKSM